MIVLASFIPFLTYASPLPRLPVVLSHGAVQFFIYENVKRMRGDSKMTSAQVFAAGAISKVGASITTYPYQVVKSRLQQSRSPYRNVAHACIEMWRGEGVRGFYRGLGVNVMKVTPATAIVFVIYEAVRASFTPAAALPER